MDKLTPKRLASGPIVRYMGMRLATSSVVEVEFWSERDDPTTKRGYLPATIIVKETNLLDGIVSTRYPETSNEVVNRATKAQAIDNDNRNGLKMLEVIEDLPI